VSEGEGETGRGGDRKEEEARGRRRVMQTLSTFSFFVYLKKGTRFTGSARGRLSPPR